MAGLVNTDVLIIGVQGAKAANHVAREIGGQIKGVGRGENGEAILVYSKENGTRICKGGCTIKGTCAV